MDPLDAQLEHLSVLTGAWASVARHPMLPGDVIRGRATFEWLDGGRRFLVWRAHHEHPDVPDGISVMGVTDDELRMHYFDSRGVHRLYSVSAGPGTWRFWRNARDLSQRFVGTVTDGGATMVCRGEMSRDGGEWEEDLELTYRRAT